MLRSIKQAASLTLAAALAASLAGCSLLPKEEAALKPPLVKPAQENYSTAKVEKGTIIKKIDSLGILESVSTDLAQFTGKGGRIEKILVSAGDQVKKGDVLVQLVMDDVDLQLKEQELALERAKFALKEARNSDEELLRMAQLQVGIEQLKYDRLNKLFNTKQLRSNIDGQVVFVESLKEGDFVEPFQTIVTVADPSKLQVSLRVDSTSDIQSIDVGMPAEVIFDSNTTSGKVVQTPNSAPLTLNRELAERYARTMYIDAPKLPEGAGIGDSVNVVIITHKKENVLKIPRSGFRAFLGRTFVRVLEAGNRIREVDVEQGITTPTTVEIISGLEEGQNIILQ